MGQWEDAVTFYILDTQSTREVGTITTDCDRKSPAHGPPSPAAAVGLVRLFSKLGTGGDPGPNCAAGAGLFRLESLRLFSSETGVIIVHTPLWLLGTPQANACGDPGPGRGTQETGQESQDLRQRRGAALPPGQGWCWAPSAWDPSLLWVLARRSSPLGACPAGSRQWNPWPPAGPSKPAPHVGVVTND